MQERRIVPEINTAVVTIKEAANTIEDEGLILVKRNDQTIGSVTYNNSRFTLNTIYEFEECKSLSEIVKEYAKYTFTLIHE